MSSGESGNLWFLQPPGKDGDHSNQQTPPAPPQSHQTSKPVDNFSKLSQLPPPQEGPAYPSPPPSYDEHSCYSPPQGPPHSPPQQGSPYHGQQGPPYNQQQGGPFTPPQGTPYLHQQGSPYSQQTYSPQQQGPYPPQQNPYAQPGPYTSQQGYPQQQGSPYPPQSYPSQTQSQFSDPNSQTSGEAFSFYGSGPPSAIRSGSGPGGPDQREYFNSAIQFIGAQQPPPGPDGLDRGLFSSRNPLDPPPNMFKRPAPGHYAYIDFRPISVFAVSDRLQDGFALIPPTTAPGEPHPFISHDITEEDWHKFLKDFQKTAHLSPSDRLFQGISNSFMKDKIPSAKVQRRLAENRLEPINDYLMAWNHYFFRPRRMSVVLAKGNDRFSGETDDYPPDVGRRSKKASKEKKKKGSRYQTRSTGAPSAAEPYSRGSLLGELLNPIHKVIYDVSMAPQQLLLGTQPRGLQNSRSRRDSDSDDSDSSSSSSSESDDHRYKRQGGLAGIRAERERRMQGRRAKKEERRDRKGKRHGKGKESVITPDFPSTKFRLVVCYWDGQQEVY